MSFQPTLRAAALAAATLLSAGLSQAAVVTYYFEDTLGREGEFSFDDANVTTVANPLGGTSGAAYQGISLSFDGVNYANPVLAIYDNFLNGNEFVQFIDGNQPTNYLYVSNHGHALFSSNAASEMTSRTLADFTASGAATFGGVSHTLAYFSTIPQAAPVPEPEGYALMLAGLAMLGAAARRRAEATMAPIR